MAIEPMLESLQNMEVGVSGPDGANRMFITTGLARVNLTVTSSGMRKENYAVHVGPPLTVQQFRRSIATASVAQVRLQDFSAASDLMRWEIEEVDADFDDESDRVELKFTLDVEVEGGVRVGLHTVAFTVTTLAEL